MKRELVESNARRMAAIESGERVVVGVNRFREAEPSPLLQGSDSILSVDEAQGREQIERLRAHRAGRSKVEVESALRAPWRSGGRAHQIGVSRGISMAGESATEPSPVRHDRDAA